MKFSELFMLCASVNIISGTFVNTKDLPSIIPAERICKSGPASKNIPGKLNCLIIGDSISIGYVWSVSCTPLLKKKNKGEKKGGGPVLTKCLFWRGRSEFCFNTVNHESIASFSFNYNKTETLTSTPAFNLVV